MRSGPGSKVPDSRTRRAASDEDQERPSLPPSLEPELDLPLSIPQSQFNDSSIASEEEKQWEVAQDQQDSDSSADSSPLREPQAPLVPILRTPSGEVVYGITDDPVAAQAYHWAYRKYEEKLGTITDTKVIILCFLLYYGFPKQKKIFLNASKSVVSLSAYHDGTEINQCTGIVVEWDDVKKSAIILTSAWIICTKKPFDDWSYKDYAPEAKVIVRIPDDTTSDCRLLYFSKHFDIAFFETMGELTLPIVPLKPDLEYGQNLCVLARDNKTDLICTTVRVKYVDPYEYQHNHYLFIDGSIPKCGTGGALADFSGNIVGMLFCTLPIVAFIPSSLILTSCLKLRTVDFLEMAHIELLSRKYNIASGLIVRECAAEKHGIRVGDVILSCQGENISNVTQLEDILLGVGERHLEKGNDSGSKVDVEVGVFHVRKCSRRLVTLTVELSDVHLSY
uniref:PDZ domain-containing protein n=1 Tax=Oryza meridionalis TaxID=40149 RepID=A0A0E0D499_9ORYZ